MICLVWHFFLFFSILSQAVVNYDEIKNFIRQQVIKIFDGEDMCLTSPSLGDWLNDFFFLLLNTTAFTNLELLFYYFMSPLLRENGLLYVSGTDASRNGSISRSAWAPREQWSSR